MALWKGSDCLCGNALPPDSTQTDGSNCNNPCDGWPQDTCGGSNTYDIYLTGTEDTVSTLSSTTATATPSANTDSSNDANGPPSVITQAGATIVVTASSQTDNSQSNKSSGPNIAGIAAGVVVGVGVIGIIIGAALFFIRRHKRKAVEAQYRRNAAISFGPGKTASTGSMNDSRWDGEYMAQRRQSNGSIAEDEDFSRRILKVTNPDK
jgi:cell wall integrity and stress response component